MKTEVPLQARRMNRRATALCGSFAIGGAVLLGGCDAQRSPEYPGEPLTTVSGRIVNDRTTALPRAGVVAAWGQVGAMFGISGTAGDVKGVFPESFDMTFYQPPADQWMFNPSASFEPGFFDPAAESRIAIAHILAVKKTGDNEGGPDAVVGGAERHAIVYVERDLAPGTAGAALLHGALTAGYHLMDVRPVPENEARAVLVCESAAKDIAAWKACGVNAALHAAPPGTTITVRLVNERAELDFPSYLPLYVAPGTPVDPPPPPLCNPMLGMPCP